MPLSPDIVAEFVVPICPPDEILDQLAEQLSANFLLSLEADQKALAVCAPRLVVETNVVTVGMWVESDGFSDDELRGALVDSSLLTPGRTIALLVTARAIQRLVAEVWAAADKSIGRITLGEEISVDVGSDGIVTEVRGTYDPPLFVFPDLDFTYTIRESLSLRPAGSAPPVEARTSTDLDVGAPGLLAASLIVGVLNPILGAIVFFGVQEIAESQAPEVLGVGGALASQWPSEILTQIEPPFLPGKFILSWSDLTVDEEGVRTLGIFTPTERAPKVSIVGPLEVRVQEALGHKEARYHGDIHDLRAPLTTQWSGAVGGSELATSVLFFSASVGQKPISVSVRDVDGLSAADAITVRVSAIPLEDGQQPF